jgi:8-oxo-dGTP pyrophosphatase MutT (NUDIX family)
MRAPNRVVGVVVHDGRLLLIQRFRNDLEFFVFLGGAVEPDEVPDAALRRIIREQTGLPVILFHLLFEEQDEHAFTWYFFTCELGLGVPQFGGPELEHQTPTNQFRLEWVDPEQLPILKPYPLPSRLLSTLLQKA